jgi:hypothetical protein
MFVVPGVNCRKKSPASVFAAATEATEGGLLFLKRRLANSLDSLDFPSEMACMEAFFEATSVRSMNLGMATAARMPRITSTAMISINVKPF